MSIYHIIKTGVAALIILVTTSCASNLVYHSAKSETRCSEKNGYWYKDQCWKDFEEEDITDSNIDSTVSSQMELINKSTIKIGDSTFPMVAFLPLEEKDGYLLIAVYGKNNNYKTLIFPTEMKEMKKGSFESVVILFNGDAISDNLDQNTALKGTATVFVSDVATIDFKISGMITLKNGSTAKFSFNTNEAIVGAGNSQIEVRGDEAFLSGALGTVTYSQISYLIKNHPEVKTIVMTNVSGSVNDAVNMHTGRLVYENGFTTKVLSDSDIASGGVDLFCAGKTRIVEKGAKIGVHSWCCVNDLTAIEIPRDHPAHKYQLEYFTLILGDVNDPGFYFYTLEAAPFDDIHYMTDEEIIKWNVATDFVEK